MKTSTFQLVLYSLRFLAVLLGVAGLAVVTALVTAYLDLSLPVALLIYLLLAGAYWLFAEKIMGKEPGL